MIILLFPSPLASGMALPTQLLQLCQQQCAPISRGTASLCPTQIGENSHGEAGCRMQDAGCRTQESSLDVLECCHSSQRLLPRRHRALHTASPLLFGAGEEIKLLCCKGRGVQAVLRVPVLQKGTEVTPGGESGAHTSMREA